MMIKGKNPVVLKRLPPKVVGNGYNTLNELLKKIIIELTLDEPAQEKYIWMTLMG